MSIGEGDHRCYCIHSQTGGCPQGPQAREHLGMLFVLWEFENIDLNIVRNLNFSNGFTGKKGN